ARSVEVMGEGLRLRRQRDPISEAAGCGGVAAGLQAGARGTADRLAGKGVVEMRAALRHAVEVRHQVERVAVQARRIPPLLVGEEYDEVHNDSPPSMTISAPVI